MYILSYVILRNMILKNMIINTYIYNLKFMVFHGAYEYKISIDLYVPLFEIVV